MKILIIRFSSFGDIFHGFPVVKALKERFPDTEVHWAVRNNFANLLSMHSQIDKVWSFDPSAGLLGLLRFAKELRAEKFDYIYDAHSNIRSRVISFILSPFWWSRSKLVRRGKNRIKRFLLFKLRINLFPTPFKSALSFLRPLKSWGVDTKKVGQVEWILPTELSEKLQRVIPFASWIAIVPSAAWDMKRWPIGHWRRLIELMDEENFIILGGPEDSFCEELKAVAPERVCNLAGELSMLESCGAIQLSDKFVSADTGLLHVADVLGVRGVGLIGPTAFGFTMSKKIELLEVEIPCRPCTKDGRGVCSDKIFQRCLVEITPESVQASLKKLT